MRKQHSSQFEQGASSGSGVDAPQAGDNYSGAYSPHGPEASWRHGQEEPGRRHEHGGAVYGFEAPRRSSDEHRFAHRSYPAPPHQSRSLGPMAGATEDFRPRQAYQAPASEEWEGAYQRPFTPTGYSGYGGYSGYPPGADPAGRHGQGRPSRRLMPRGYKRSDERLREDVCERMIASDLEIGDVEVEVQGGCVTVSGTVPARWTKHAIEDLVEQCTGVTDIDNRLRIQVVGNPDMAESPRRAAQPASTRARDEQGAGGRSEDEAGRS